MPDHHQLSNFIWQIADLLRGPYRPPQYERVMLPLTVLRRFDCVLAATKKKVLSEYQRWQSRLEDEALASMLNKAAGQRFHNCSPLDFKKLKGDPNQIEEHLISYIKASHVISKTYSTALNLRQKSKRCTRRTFCISSSLSSATWTCTPTVLTIFRWDFCSRT